MAVTLQANDRELAQGNKDLAAIFAHSEITVKALADTRRDLTDIAITAARLAAVHQFGVQNDGIYGLYYSGRHIALLNLLAVQAVDTGVGAEDTGVALAAEKDDPLVEDT